MTAKARDEVVWDRTEQLPVVDEIGGRCWRWVGYTLNRSDINITMIEPTGTKEKGRARMKWRKRQMDTL